MREKQASIAACLDESVEERRGDGGVKRAAAGAHAAVRELHGCAGRMSHFGSGKRAKEGGESEEYRVCAIGHGRF